MRLTLIELSKQSKFLEKSLKKALNRARKFNCDFQVDKVKSALISVQISSILLNEDWQKSQNTAGSEVADRVEKYDLNDIVGRIGIGIGSNSSKSRQRCSKDSGTPFTAGMTMDMSGKPRITGKVCCYHRIPQRIRATSRKLQLLPGYGHTSLAAFHIIIVFTNQTASCRNQDRRSRHGVIDIAFNLCDNLSSKLCINTIQQNCRDNGTGL